MDTIDQNLTKSATTETAHAAPEKEQVLSVLGSMGAGTADQVTRKIEELFPEVDNKEIIGKVHHHLSQLHEQGQITAAAGEDGDLIYSQPGK